MPKVKHYKREAYKQAYFYRQRGFTYAEIAKLCDVSRSTLSNWFAKESFSKQVAEENMAKAVAQNTKRLASINKARSSERQKQYQAAVKAATVSYQNYKQHPLFMAGVALYMGQHAGEPGKIVYRGTNRQSHKIFLHFAVRFLGVEREQVRFWLATTPMQNYEDCLAKWTKNLQLKRTQCYAGQIIASSRTTPPLHYGVGHTIIGSTVLRRTLDRWVELAGKELTK